MPTPAPATPSRLTRSQRARIWEVVTDHKMGSLDEEDVCRSISEIVGTEDDDVIYRIFDYYGAR